MNSSWKVCLVLLSVTLLVSVVSPKKADPKAKPAWAKKDIRDFDEADMERLLDQWEEDDEPLPDDELPEHKRKDPPIPDFNFDKVGSMSPDEILKLTKKGKTLMMFVNLNGNPSKHESETLTSLYQGALRNNHIQAERYVIDDARAIFLFQDGAQAWDAKEFLVEQERVDSVTLESQQYPGKHKTPSAKDSKSNKKSEL